MKKGPVLVLACLFILLVFIVGVQYGKRVQVADEVLEILSKITPTTQPKKEAEPIVEEFVPFESAICGISFLYPSSIVAVKQSSNSAEFVSKNEKLQALSFSCTQTSSLSAQLKTASPEGSIILNNVKIETFKDESSKPPKVLFQFRHPVKKHIISIRIIKELLPLFTRTFQIVSE